MTSTLNGQMKGEIRINRVMVIQRKWVWCHKRTLPYLIPSMQSSQSEYLIRINLASVCPVYFLIVKHSNSSWTWPTRNRTRSAWMTGPGWSCLLSWPGMTKRTIPQNPSWSPTSRRAFAIKETLSLWRNMEWARHNWGGGGGRQDLLTYLFV